MPEMKKTTKTSSRATGGKKPKMWPVEFCGVEQKMFCCPHRKRLVVVTNEGMRKGFLILRSEDGALVSWARLKVHAATALEQLEDVLDTCRGVLQEKTVWYTRRQLSVL